MTGILRGTLYARLATGLFVLLVAVGLLYAFIGSVAIRHYQETLSQTLNRDLARDLVFDRNLVDEGRLNQTALKETFELYMTINPGIEIYLLDREGTILSYSADPGKVVRKRVSLPPIHRFLDDEAAYPVPGDDPRSHDRQKVFSATPVPSAEQPEGYLYVVLRGEEYDSAERMARGRHYFEMSAWAVTVSLIFGLIAGLVVFRLLTRRLEHLSRRVECFEAQAGGEAFEPAVDSAPPATRGADEIERLGMAFDRMAERIARQIEQLHEQDALRRRLVAQVSHDLRTPLASMQGYLESLKLKGTTLSEAQRAEFLDIALTQSRRLGRLVGELFELAALEAREKQPRAEPFAPAELLHDVARKHEPAAAVKEVTLTVTAEPDLPFALADLGMTERVLDNLINNAVAYAPRRGQLEIGVRTDRDSLRISVADDGPGIAPDDLPHLFEPFYRGKTGTPAGHAGLGLAIAQRIMALQNGSMAARNRPGGGAEFILRLPLAGPDVMQS